MLLSAARASVAPVTSAPSSRTTIVTVTLAGMVTPIPTTMQSNGTIIPAVDPNVIEVPDIEAAVASVTEAGAVIVVEKNPIPGVGYSAYFTDPEGNRVGLFESDESVTV